MFSEFNYSFFTIAKVLTSETNLHTNIDIHSITTSSAECKQNSIFIPLKGNRDGHEFILDAIQNGASCFLFEKENPYLKKIPKKYLERGIEVENTLTSLGKLAEFHRSRFHPILIGITGSSGKTTTKELMGLIAKEYGEDQVVVTEKNYNNEIGVPFTLFKINFKTKLVICEMGMNHKYEISRLTKMAKPTISIITNIGPCHIENLGSLKGIAEAKAEIIESMQKGSKVLIPKNVEHLEVFQKKADKYKVEISYFSLQKSKLIQLEKTFPEGFQLKIAGESFTWNLPGIKILENLTAILEVANELKIDKTKIISGLKKFKSKDKRFVLEKIKDYFIINDTYNANPDSMKSSIQAVEQLSDKKGFYLVLGDMKELGKFSKKYHSELGEFIAKTSVKGIITYGKDSEWILNSTTKKVNLKKHFYTSEQKKLCDTLLSIPKNSYILFKGSRSMKMEDLIQGLQNV
jgi:UDP-N-acetylmuramoyl-tripeptide--D-alanyl-D-alanine ligase